MIRIPEKATEIMQMLDRAGARDVIVVGGFVRDALLGIHSEDVDIEVYGLSIDQIATALSPRFRVDLVGKAFGVAKIENKIDVSVPRRENKIGVGHRGFEILPDPQMSIRDAASRRDFTINSMGMHRDGTVVDPYNGLQDLKAGILRHTSKAYVEDPLRVLRGMQFTARFGFSMAPETVEMSRRLRSEARTLAVERVWVEWHKWALLGARPSLGLTLLKNCGWLDLYPEAAALVGVPQDPEWHPEGDVWVHTLHVVDAAADLAVRNGIAGEDRSVLLFAALAHDFGKPSTTERIDDRLRSRGHCEAGVSLAESFLKRIGAPGHLTEKVGPLVAEHLVHVGIECPTPRMIRRLSNRLGRASIESLSMLIEADHSGRPPLPPGNPFSDWVDVARELEIADRRPRPILMGRHLIDSGVSPGPRMGRILTVAFDAQLDGEFDNLEQAQDWLKRLLASEASGED